MNKQVYMQVIQLQTHHSWKRDRLFLDLDDVCDSFSDCRIFFMGWEGGGEKINKLIAAAICAF